MPKTMPAGCVANNWLVNNANNAATNRAPLVAPPNATAAAWMIFNWGIDRADYLTTNNTVQPK